MPCTRGRSMPHSMVCNEMEGNFLCIGVAPVRGVVPTPVIPVGHHAMWVGQASHEHLFDSITNQHASVSHTWAHKPQLAPTFTSSRRPPSVAATLISACNTRATCSRSLPRNSLCNYINTTNSTSPRVSLNEPTAVSASEQQPN